MNKQDLVNIARTRIPFGKYQGSLLIDLPEEYLLWFARKEAFPKGELGRLLQITMAIKVEGLQKLVEPLKENAAQLSDGELSALAGSDFSSSNQVLS